MDDTAGFIYSILITIVMIIVFGFMVQSCDKQTRIISRDTKSKCYEMTQDKACWDLK